MSRDRPPDDPHLPRRPPPEDQPALRLALPGGAVPLEALMLREPSMPPARAVAILRDVAHAVDLLAGAGRVYGAISPATIAVDPHGHARLVPPEDVEVLRPAYLAPEQRAGARTGRHLDQYALAVVARELLHHVDVGTWEVVRRALAPDPSARFPSAGAFVEALAVHLDVPAVAPSPDDDVAARAVAERLARGARPADAGRARARRLRGIVSEVVAIGGIAVLIVAIARGDRPFAWLSRWRGQPTPVIAPPSAAVPGDAPSGFVRVRVDGGQHPTILLDGRAVDTAPAVVTVRPGVHRVALRGGARAYAPPVVTIRVTAGDTARVVFTRP
ncbi:MAG: hypothetical protein ACXWZS_00565 [Gemmatirosa sp.]